MVDPSANAQLETPTRGLWLTLLLVFAIYAPSLGNGFAVDAALLAKPTFRNGGEQKVISTLHSPAFYFTQNYWAGNETYDALYRPIPIYSFALTHHLFSKSLAESNHAIPHHIIDLILHLIAVVLVWRFVIDVGLKPPIAVLTALLFGVHAIHHEVVVSIVGRTELLAFLGGLGATLLLGRGTARSLVLASVLLLIALLSKESALAWVAFSPCYELARGWQRGTTRPWLRNYALVVIPAVLVWFLLRHNALADMSHIPREIEPLKNPLAHVDAATRIFTATKIWGFALYKCVVPYPLAFLYGLGAFTMVDSPTDIGFLTAAVALLALLTLGLLLARKVPVLFLGVALLLGFSFISSNVPLVAGTILGERLFYTPSLGLCLFVALLLIRLARHSKPLHLGLGAYVIFNVAVVVSRNSLWDDDEFLLLHDVVTVPGAANMHHDIAAILYNRNPPEKAAALASVHRAVEIYPEYPQALLKIATFHLARNEIEESKRWYVRACHSPFIHIGLRLTVQRALEDMLFPGEPKQKTLATIRERLKTDGDIAATWVAFVDRAATTPGFTADELSAVLASTKSRFPHDQLLAIQRGLFASRDGIRDAAEARVILDEFSPGLWRLLPQHRAIPMFVRARIIAAACYVALSDRTTAGHILDAMLNDESLSSSQRSFVASRKQELLRG